MSVKQRVCVCIIDFFEKAPYLRETDRLHGSEPLHCVVRVSEVQPFALKIKNKMGAKTYKLDNLLEVQRTYQKPTTGTEQLCEMVIMTSSINTALRKQQQLSWSDT